jgi:hypothetical protein
MRRLAVVTLAGLSACSSSSTAPLARAKVTVISGAGQSDTVQATVPGLLTVQVSGSGSAGAVVQFVPADTADAYVMAPSGAATPALFVADTSDANGKASARVVLGTHAGVARVIVRVPALALVDTAAFTVTPGAAAALTGGPRDTTLYVGTALAVRITVADRFGNPRTDRVTLGSLVGPIVLSGADTIRSQAYGTASIVATAGPFADTLRLAIVPPGQLAAVGQGMVMFNLDGSGYRQLANVSGAYPRWSPSGARIVFDGASTLASIDTTGAFTQFGVVSSSEQLPVQQFPQFSRDGQWVYFSQVPLVGYGQTLWRTAGTGTGLEQSVLSTAAQNTYAPSPSPDGTHLVYVQGDLQTTNLEILDLSTGVSDSLPITGTLPVWAPTGDLIAFNNLNTGQIFVVHSDGTGQRAIGTVGAVYGQDVDWSPDGQWIVAANATTGLVEVINVSSNLVLPLTYTQGLSQPIWRP